VTDDTARPQSGKGPDPQAELLDRLSADAVLDLLGPDWSTMSAAERTRHRPPLDDPAFTALETFAAGQDLAAQSEQETADVLDRIEAHLAALEWRYVTSPQARYHAALRKAHRG
jgi:hypothetical protein